MKEKQSPPVAKKAPKIQTLHGVTWNDDYSWMQEKASSEALSYAQAENDYVDAETKSQTAYANKLYREMKSRMKETDMSVPVKKGAFEYYVRTVKGKQYAIHCRKRIGTRTEEVLLDENKLAEGQKYFNVGLVEVSPDHSLLAYSVDVTGNEKQTLVIKDIVSGNMLTESIQQISDFEWAEDGVHFFYTVEEHPHPPRKVMRHKLGSPVVEDVLVYEETDPQWYVFLSKSNDEQFIFIGAANFDASEMRVVNARKPDEKPVLFAPRQKKVKYWPEHHNGYFYFLTNEKAVEYKILRTQVVKPERPNWKVWMAHDKKRSIDGFIPYKDFFVITLRERGTEEMLISNPERSREKKVALPEADHSVSVWGSVEYESPCIRFSYDSFLTPKTVYEYTVATRKYVVKKKQEVPKWDSKKYVSKRVWCKSGTAQVPVVLVHKKTLRYNATAPLLLQAYGSYGICQDPSFSITKIPLLERGWIIALAQPRGGGEMGNKWHDDAKLMKKHRTYDDVIAVTDALVQKKICSRKKLILVGGSAGGMMVGAVLNKRPDCVGGAIAYVPAADTLSSMLDESLGGTRLHYDEIGDPRKKNEFLYIKKTSPYENVKKAAYPPLLVRASVSDIRTPFWEAAKWVARLRAQKTDENKLFLKIEMSAGHFGKSGRYEYLKERAWDFAFLQSVIG